MLTSFDITKAVAFKKTKVSEIVTKKVISVSPEDTLYDLVNKLKKYNISSMPVIDGDNKVLGIVSAGMLVKNLVPKPREKQPDDGYDYEQDHEGTNTLKQGK